MSRTKGEWGKEDEPGTPGRRIPAAIFLPYSSFPRLVSTPEKKSRGPKKFGGERVGGREVRVFPGQNGSKGTAGYPWRGEGKGQHRNQRSRGHGRAGAAPGARGNAAGRHLLPLSDSVPPNMAAPPRQRRLAIPALQRGISPAKHSRNKRKPSLGTARPRLPRIGPRRCRGGGGQAVGRGRREKMAAWQGCARGTQHSRPAPRVAPPQRLLRSATQAELTLLATPAPRRSRGAAGGGIKGDAALCPRRRLFAPPLRGGIVVLERRFHGITGNSKLAESCLQYVYRGRRFEVLALHRTLPPQTWFTPCA